MILTLTTLRYRANLSQSELARLTGITQPTISNYERGLEILPDHAESILMVLRDRLPDSDLGYDAEDLSRPWQEVLGERSSN